MRTRNFSGVLALLSALAQAVAPPAAAGERMASDDLSAERLAVCDAGADALGGYEAPVAAAVASLVDLGVVAHEDLDGVRIGFCDLVGSGGPVATTACADDVILLDRKYRRRDNALSLATTLAHEITHVAQHRTLRARRGDGYCASPSYLSDRPALEAAADRVDAAVGELLVRGRDVEVVNECAADVRVFIEPDAPAAFADEPAGFFSVAAKSRALAPVRAMSRRVSYFVAPPARAERAPSVAPGAHWSRYLEGRTRPMTRVALDAPQRLGGPFEFRIVCAPDGSG